MTGKLVVNLLTNLLQDLAGGSGVWLPDLLLTRYKRLGLNELEVMVVVHLWRLVHRLGDPFPSLQKLHELMAADPQIIQGAIASLIEKKLLSVVSRYDERSGQTVSRYVFDGLFSQMAEAWLAESRTTVTAEGTGLTGTFEREFGRPLSPMEMEQISSWVAKDGYAPELVEEALRRSVLRGVYNLRYINSILHHWAKNNVRTVKEARAYEERYLQHRRRAGPGRPEPVAGEEPDEKKDKYRDIYLT